MGKRVISLRKLKYFFNAKSKSHKSIGPDSKNKIFNTKMKIKSSSKMRMREIQQIILFGIFVGVYSTAYSQGWTAEITIDINHINYGLETINSASVTYSGQTKTISAQSTSSATISFTGSGTPTGNLSINASGTATGPYSPSDPFSTTFSATYTGLQNNMNCNTVSFFSNGGPGNQYEIYGSIILSPILNSTGTSPGNLCSGSTSINLNASSEFTTYVWQFSTLPSSGFQDLKTTSSNAVSINYSELAAKGINLTQNVYVRYTLGNNCVSSSTGAFSFDPPAPVVTSLDPKPCENKINVTLERPVGNTDLFQVYLNANSETDNSWKTSGSSISISNVSGGTHSVRAMNADHNGCSMGNFFGTTVEVPITPLGFATLSVSNVTCYGESNGSITVTGKDGIAPYTYSVDGNSFTNLSAGIYNVTVTDANGCTKTAQVTIDQPTEISVSASVTSSYNGSHISCVGSSNGIITASASGGTNSFTYSINGLVSVSDQVSNVFNSLSAGSYTVSVKDGNQCTKSTSTITISSPTAITPSASVTSNYNGRDISCVGSSDGNITASASGGAGSFEYSLGGSVSRPLQASPIFSGLPSGNYFITARDVNLCSGSSSSLNILSPPDLSISAQVTSNFNGSGISCVGSTNGVIEITASGGTGSFNYSMDDFTYSSSNQFNNLGAGNYSLIVKDNNSCKKSTNISISNPPGISFSVSIVNVSCFNGNDGKITITASGGSGSKTFSLNGINFQSSTAFQNLQAGSYSVTTKDANNCSITTPGVAVSQPVSAVSVSLQSKTDVSCFNIANGSLTVTASGGTGALSFSKDGANFQGSPTFAGLINGDYNITAKDVNGCSQTTSTISITQPAAPLTFGSITKLNPSCFGASNGSIQVNANGGTSPYQYSRDGVTYSSSSSMLDLTPGTYVVTIKDAKNCTFNSTTQSIIDPPVISTSTIPTSQSCIEIVDGEISATASGGTGTLNYSIDGIGFQTDNIFSGLSSGSYTIYVQDENSCLKTSPVNVGLASPISATITQTAFINCFGQSTAALDLFVSGGTAGYTFNWSNGSTSQNIHSLSAETYDVTIFDSKGCTQSSQFQITAPALLQASAITSNFNGYGVTCSGSADGFINLSVTGGTSPYSYGWSNGANSKDISGINANSYDVTVIDSKACTANASATLLSPAPVSVLIDDKLNVTCFGGFNGSIDVSGNGGTGNFVYSFDGDPWGPQSLFSDLTEGVYTIQSKDENNCVSLDALSFTITQPSEINVLLSNYVDASCGQANGSIEASASGGIGQISYEWLDQSGNVIATAALLDQVVSGAYSLTVADSSNCIQTVPAIVGSYDGAQFNVDSIIGVTCPGIANGKADINILTGHAPFSITWGNGETSSSAVQLPRGQNTVIVTDVNNCSVASTFTVPSPVPITLNSIQKNLPDCPGGTNGSIQVSAVGGTGAYTYKWGGLIGSSSLLNIPAGNYSLSIEDSQNCSLGQIITLNDKTPIKIDIVNLVTPTCSYSSDGSLQINASGGNGSFKFNWDNEATTAAINKLQGGTYEVTVTDLKNCSQQKSIPLIQPDEINGQIISSTDVSCHGGSNGTITVEATGGNGSLEYSINSGKTWKSQNSFTNLTAGEISVIGRDKLGCLVYFEFSLAEPAQLTGNITDLVHTSCNLPNGSANVIAAGGTGPYNYKWINSSNLVVENSSSLKAALADDYKVTVTDGNLCAVSSSLKINSSTNTIFKIKDISATLCPDSKDGSAILEIMSAVSPYSILWSDGETGLSATKLTSGNAYVTITDANACKAQSDFTVPNATPIAVIAEIISDPLCTNANGSVQVFVNGGTSPYTFLWNEKPGKSLNQDLKAATHHLAIEDANNCRISRTYTLTDPPPFVIELGPDKIVCSGTTVNIGMDIPLTTFSWSGPNNFQSTSSIVTIAEEGTYQLEATSNLGCKAHDSFILTLTENLLNADFLTSTKAFVNDSIIMIDISWPVPTSVFWNFPSHATVLVSNKDYAIIQFAEPGLYPVSLLAHLGNCRSNYSQNISIEERQAPGGRHSAQEIPNIISITAYPNPFNPIININIEMNVASTVDLKVYHLMSNKLMHHSELVNQKHYSIELDFGNRDSGIYVVIASVENQIRALRIIKE